MLGAPASQPVVRNNALFLEILQWAALVGGMPVNNDNGHNWQRRPFAAWNLLSQGVPSWL
jgi:hypothetical protein